MPGPTVNQGDAIKAAKGKSEFSRLKVIWSEETGAPRIMFGIRDLRLPSLDVVSFLSDKEMLRDWLKSNVARSKIASEAVQAIEKDLGGAYCDDPTDFSLQLSRIDLDARHRLVMRFNQLAESGGKKIPVHRFGLTMHLPDALRLSRISGPFAGRILESSPLRTATKVCDLLDSRTDMIRVDGFQPQLVYLPLINERRYPLAWRCLVRAVPPKGKGPLVPCMKEVFIEDAAGGRVLRQSSLVSCFTCTGVPYYPVNGAKQPISFETIYADGRYRLEDESAAVKKRGDLRSGLAIRTKACVFDQGHDLCACAPLTCQGASCNRQANCPSSSDVCSCPVCTSTSRAWDDSRSIEVEAHANSGRFFAFMRREFGHLGVTVTGPDNCELCVHHDQTTSSFYYHPPVYSDMPFRVYIPSGAQGMGPFCGKDIIAHEWTHAIIDALDGPENSGYEAAIREGLCDAFASFFMESEGVGQWRLGSNMRDWPVKCYRDMADPQNGGTTLVRAEHLVTRPSDTASSSYVIDQLRLADQGVQPDHFQSRIDPDRDPVPAGYVDGYDHLSGWARVNSGIVNKATHLLCEGGRGGGADDPIPVYRGLGLRVTKALYYRMLGERTCPTFEWMRDALLGFLFDEMCTVPGWAQSQSPQSDRERKADYLLDVAAVINAFAAIGVPQGGCYVEISDQGFLDALLHGAWDNDRYDGLLDSLDGWVRRKFPSVEFPEWM